MLVVDSKDHKIIEKPVSDHVEIDVMVERQQTDGEVSTTVYVRDDGAVVIHRAGFGIIELPAADRPFSLRVEKTALFPIDKPFSTPRKKKKAKALLSIRDQYPNHPPNHSEKSVSHRGGFKVRWESFATKAEADRAAKWALVEAEIKERQGFDPGYCSPGSVAKKQDGTWEVCFL